VITVEVRWYLRYGLSYRDVEELLAERGVEVDHVTVYRWVQRFTPLFADAARPLRHATGDRWFMDETYVKLESAAGTTICPNSRGASLCSTGPAQRFPPETPLSGRVDQQDAANLGVRRRTCTLHADA
jgi:hypothetical protein